MHRQNKTLPFKPFCGLVAMGPRAKESYELIWKTSISLGADIFITVGSIWRPPVTGGVPTYHYDNIRELIEYWPEKGPVPLIGVVPEAVKSLQNYDHPAKALYLLFDPPPTNPALAACQDTFCIPTRYGRVHPAVAGGLVLYDRKVKGG
jgi:hypothetical protein